MKINVLLDTPDSFLHDYVNELIRKIEGKGHQVNFCQDHREIDPGDMLFLLACKTILTKKHLSLNKNNLVIHPSKLPEGRGSAALIWKILEGANKIYITLFEANEAIDQGHIYLQEAIEFEGYELSDEIRHKQALKTMEMVLRFVEEHKNLKPRKQEGKGSFYKKRTSKDSELDIDKTIREQFNLLRVVDNNQYPAFFYHNGHKYLVKVYREDQERNND